MQNFGVDSMVSMFTNIAPKLDAVSNKAETKVATVTKAKTAADIRNGAVL